MSGLALKVAVVFWRFGPYHHARLNAAGRKMNVFAIEACGMDQTYAWEKVEGSDNFCRITLTERHSNTRQWQKQLRQEMFAKLGEIKPDAVAVPGWSYHDALTAMQWCMQSRVPAVVMSDSTAWDARRRWWKEIVKRQMVACYSAGLVAGTPHQEYLVQLGMNPADIFLGYDAVNNDYFSQRTKEIRDQELGARNQTSNLQSPASESCQLSTSRCFLVPARFIWEKNLLRLLEAYALYRKKAKSGKQRTEIWDLILLGDGELRSDICHLISDLRLQHCVHMPGFQQYDELPKYYGLASAAILPSISETWGLVVNEAMASGLPVLVSNRCGCARDLVQDGVNGFTFDPYNVEQLANLMMRVASLEQGARSKMGLESQRIIDAWGPERFASSLKAAAECALRVGPIKSSLVQRAILKALLSR